MKNWIYENMHIVLEDQVTLFIYVYNVATQWITNG